MVSVMLINNETVALRLRPTWLWGDPVFLFSGTTLARLSSPQRHWNLLRNLRSSSDFGKLLTDACNVNVTLYIILQGRTVPFGGSFPHRYMSQRNNDNLLSVGGRRTSRFEPSMVLQMAFALLLSYFSRYSRRNGYINLSSSKRMTLTVRFYCWNR